MLRSDSRISLTKEPLSRLRLCQIVLGCKSCDPCSVKQFIGNIDTFVSEAANDGFVLRCALKCVVSILTSKKCVEELGDVNEILDIVVGCGSLSSSAKEELLLSLIALNVAVQRDLLSQHVSNRAVAQLLSLIRSFMKRFQDVAPHGQDTLLALALRAALGILEHHSNGSTCVVGDVNVVVKELLQFYSSERSGPFEKQVKEDTLKLAVCFVKLEANKSKVEDTTFDPFLASWAMKTLSGEENDHSTASTLCMQLALWYMYLICNPIPITKAGSALNRSSKRPLQGNEKKTKLAQAMLKSGVVVTLIFLLVHSDHAIRDLSRKTLERLIGYNHDKASQSAKKKRHVYIDIVDLNVVGQLLRQSVVPVLLCIKEAMFPAALESSRLLEAMATKMSGTVLSALNERNPDIVIREIVNADDLRTSVQAHVGLLLLMTMRTSTNSRFNGDFLQSLMASIVRSISTQPKLIESGMMFWHAVEFLIDAQSRRKMDDKAHDRPSDDAAESIQILFRSSVDNTETFMECPSLVELKNLIPGLASQIESQQRDIGYTVPVICGSSYEMLEKLVNDASCYEAQTRQQVVDEMYATGDDALDIDECLELLYFAHMYSANELKQKYSILCSIKVDEISALSALEGAVKSECFELALDAFRLVRNNMIHFIREEHKLLETFPKVITALLDLALGLSTRVCFL